MRFKALILCLWLPAAILHAQAPIDARDKPSDYAVSTKVDRAEFAAEYHGRGVPAGERSFLTGNYIVLELAVFPSGLEPMKLVPGRFTLRINSEDKRTAKTLSAQPPSMVAWALAHPDSERARRLEAMAGVGGSAVILGRPQRTARFPATRQCRRRHPGPRLRKPPSFRRSNRSKRQLRSCKDKVGQKWS